ARRMMEQTGCDAVMIGRGAIGNPWLFRQARAALGEIPMGMNDTPTLDEVIQHTISHVEKMVERKGERKGIKEFRKHGMSYLKRCPLARKNRSIFFELNNLDAIKEYLTAMTNS
ncbi:MAG: tRNA-dihydrouridine synthase, partial [Candidatus Sumerlaeota bacterium]|nr:tRNA-dihydrouridine synthase [Candidatus Sumerlaeota bacterium]